MKTLKGKWIWWGVFVGFCEEETEYGIYISQVRTQPCSDKEMYAIIFNNPLYGVIGLTEQKLLDCFVPWVSIGRVNILEEEYVKSLNISKT